MANKVFQTIEEQIAILESRGLTIVDKSAAQEFLIRNNYYRFSGYTLTMRSNDVFEPGSDIMKALDIYVMDREMRNLLLRYLDIIETACKSVWAYEIAKTFGSVGHRDAANFNDAKRHSELIAQADDQAAKRCNHELFIKHFLTDLQQDIPVWAYVELLTFSDISKFYAISLPDTIKLVAADLGLRTNVWRYVARFMHVLANLRNLCAHGSRLYDRSFSYRPSLNKREIKYLCVDNKGMPDNSHLYGFVILMRKFLTPQEVRDMKADLRGLSERFPRADMRHYGFRSDWIKVL